MGPRLGIDIAGGAERAWLELVDLDRWPAWGPSVRAARLDDGTRRLKAGATGSVRTPVGAWVGFRVTDWHDTGSRRSWSWEVLGVPATAHTVTATGPGRCRVEIAVPWWAPAYLPVVGVGLRRIRARVETGDAEVG
ncbi:MAG: SRPBCC family protein [Nocardioidaceae bacterium]